MAIGPKAAEGGQRGFAIASLVLGVLSLPSLGLVGIGALLAIIFGVVALVKVRDEPRTYGGKAMAIAGIVLGALSIVVMPFLLGLMAAIAIPSFLRARVSANEAAAIADVRVVLRAERDYAAANSGLYGTLDCLATPSPCLAGRPHEGPAFLSREVAALGDKQGYTRAFYLGNGQAPSRLRAFAYVASPTQPGRTGVRAFCGDATGRICFTTTIREMTIVRASCPEDCRPF